MSAPDRRAYEPGRNEERPAPEFRASLGGPAWIANIVAPYRYSLGVRVMNIVKSLRRWGALLLLALSPLQIMAAAPGGYTYYEFDPAITGFDSMNYGITVESDPGPRANVFWANQFGLVGRPGGYAGMQRHSQLGGFLLFSVWGATAGRVGSPGSICGAFDELGTGYSCHMVYDWKVGHTYQFHLAHEGGGWFGVTVTDLTTGASVKIGSVLTAATQISPKNMTNWVEYWEWNWPQSNCYNQPYSRAEFLLPIGNVGTASPRVASISRNYVPGCYGRIDTLPIGTVHHYAIGNSPRGAVTDGGGLCLDARGGATTSNVPAQGFTCHGGENQAWVHGVDRTLRLWTDLCLDVANGQTAPGAPVIVFSCHGGRNQQWNRVGNQLRSDLSGLCLTSAGAATQLTIQACTSQANQNWQIPKPAP
ncbi:RICIN domain-containing protein [Lysobacter antibioticus]|nr:ricin-type beta-trefoil lectin domain protein [Lysobacter antibioticus]